MTAKKQIGFFEKYLTLWVALCIGAGIVIGNFAGESVAVLSKMEVFRVNIPVAILVWLMIYPMMLQVDFSSIKNVGKRPKGLILTLVVNWLIKPFTMAFFAWIFFTKIYAAFITPEMAGEYIAGAILLGAAPCTAMVFVWSYLTDGDPNYTLVQVSVNDLIILVAFVPIVGLLLGITDVQVPYDTLVSSVLIFVVVPLLAGYVTHKALIRKKGKEWFEKAFLPKFKPVSILALLLTLILLFAFQGNTITENPLIILLVAIPLIIQTYFIFFITWFSGRKLKLPHAICSPSAMIGASNFFELAVAVAIALFGLQSPAALVTVVGVLVEVPVMLSLVALANRWKY
ncbi:MAG: ACR3 family arsenite efflux transporter [Bacteroidales bacterium]|jgi:ACR3 family arsenite transporter|nr:ACR3 family arsenite efflux transporter [Bacteroidales bacterium]NCU35077.1 ACR3 family arsenite efflux transporter [Candidatus Falkowbacteria bacterium]MDD2633358.1 ACR3 family arsenite efflux transporter [Bacteroidales bacterium]MDD3131638.1 ACR3 family arsenite efflux transporter [Bacteroidales bacterium]MDD3525562.1 ACR3 family arsenite efflux transporter [Bacteroidales bacterium]